MTRQGIALALDVGGTKIAAAEVDVRGRLRDGARVSTPATGVWEACAALLREVGAGRPVTAVGISCAGPVDAGTRLVAPVNIPEWSVGFPLVAHVAALLPGARVALEMDGAATALAEHRLGAGAGVANLLAVVVSTGIGGGLVVGGELLTGRTGNAGHIGHTIVHGAADPCTCGGHGCLETVASGPSSVRWARAHGWQGTTGVELARDAAAGDGPARDALVRAGRALGEAFASVAALADLDLVVVGGGFAQAGPPLWDAMTTTVTEHAQLSFVRDLRVVPAALGGDASLAGAALLTRETPEPPDP
ncbi:ROK family protein [Rhodococcus rhodnii]|uniref:Glucokinase n=1 Tax=Rhodococcus rhodnii LMG 5362 TaxID=1273125 RepID=R7WM51_9NOCA|nr:ROK family protein [Rhodococcus rhodnii]EOM76340.1 glucokinase [Rhodococcus rhodnii LMG 5362]